MSFQTWPLSISSSSVPANLWTPLSSRPCLSLVKRFANNGTPLLPEHYPGSQLIRTPPPPSYHRPTSQRLLVIGSVIFRQFLAGTSRASPVAWYALVTMLSLSPRWNRTNVCQFSLPMLPSPPNCRLGFQSFSITRPPMRLLSLRPGNLLITHYGDFVNRLQQFGYPPCCHSSYRASGFYPDRAVSC